MKNSKTMSRDRLAPLNDTTRDERESGKKNSNFIKDFEPNMQQFK